jgi:hypothetical protein
MRRIIAATLLTLVLAVAVLGDATLYDYKRRVSDAARQVAALKEAGENSAAYVQEIKRLLPRSLRVELDGRAIEVDNTWLHVSLDAYNAERDEQKRENILDEAAARLYSLDERLKPEESAALSQDGPRGKIREILSRAQFAEKREDPITAFINEVKRRAFEFLRDLYLRVFNALFGVGAEASWLFRGMVLLAIAVALVVFARMLSRYQRRAARKKKRTVLGEEIESDVTSADLASAAMLAARAGDFRTGVRKLYIALLYELAERDLIELEPDLTNHEYLAKVSRFAALEAPMRYLTERFDYTWYGMFPASEGDFSGCLARYKEAIETARAIDAQAAAASKSGLALTRS